MQHVAKFTFIERGDGEESGRENSSSMSRGAEMTPDFKQGSQRKPDRRRWQNTSSSSFIIFSAWLQWHFQGERDEEKRFAGLAVKIKFDKTNTLMCSSLCLLTKKRKKKTKQQRFPCSGMWGGQGWGGRQRLLDVFSAGTQAGLGNIAEGYFSPVWSGVHW